MVGITQMFLARNRVRQGLQDLVINIVKYPVVFNAVNTRYGKVTDSIRTQIMELATNPMTDDEAQKIMELLC